MEINQKNNTGENKISFEVKGDFIDLSKTIKSFENSDQIREYIKSTKKNEVVARILAIVSIIIAVVGLFYKQ